MKKIAHVAAFVASCLYTVMVPAAAQTARIAPTRPMIEPVEGAQALNFDIDVVNDSPQELELRALRVSMIDAAGRVALSREISGMGAAPSIETIAQRRLPPHGELLFFNPFPLTPVDLDVARVSVRLIFADPEGGSRSIEASAEVARDTPRVLALPLRGRVLVWDGHELLAHHRRWDYTLPYLRGLGFSSNAMRYSYDFVIVDREGQDHTGDPAINENWFGFGAPVRAPAEGVVARVVSNHPDDRSFDPETSHADSNALFGNYVVIDHGGVYSLLGHLKQGSINVNLGDVVRRGQVMAAVGNSGGSEFPHLHYQLMDGPDMSAEGLPSLFENFSRLRGAERRHVRRGAIETGEQVQSR